MPRIGQYVLVEKRSGELPKAGVWLLTKNGPRPRVIAPCHCCDDVDEYECDPSQIVGVGKKSESKLAVILGGRRRDGYRFFLTKHGETVRLNAGCRHFTFAEAQAHWSRHASVWDNTRKRQNLNRWSLAEITRLKKAARKARWLPRT